MGLYERYQRQGKVGQRAGSQSGFSASKYYSRNAVSATKFMPPASTGGGGQKAPLDTRRPYSGVGKFNANIFGTMPSQPSPQLQAKPGAFEGVPILGGLADIANSVMKGPIGFIPFIGQGAAFSSFSEGVIGAEYVKKPENVSKWQQYLVEQQQLAPDAPVDLAKAQWEFMRQDLVKQKKVSPLISDLFMGAAPTTVGDLAGQTMKTISTPGMLFQRGLSGTGSRIRDLANASDEQLEGDTNLISIRDRFKSGELTHDEALDELTIAGQAMSNPLGQSDWANGIRNVAKGTPFQLPAEVVANVSAAAVSLGLEIVTDPVNLISLGTASAIRMSAKGAAKAILSYSDNIAREAIEQEGLRLGRALSKGEASVIDQNARRGAMNGLMDALPEGVAPTNANWMRYGLEKGIPGLREASSKAGIAGPLIRNQHTLKWVHGVENALDPLTLFGKGLLGKATTKMVSLQIADGVLDSLNRKSVSKVFDLLENAGVETDRVGGDMGTAMSNLSSQVGGELYARMSVSMGIGIEDVADPVLLTNNGADMLARQGTEVRSLVKHKMEKVRHLIIQQADETWEAAVGRERDHIADQLVKMYDIDPDVARSIVGQMNENELGVVRMLSYGNKADNLLNARTVARSEAIAAGLPPEFADRFIFLSDNQLSRGGAAKLQRLVNLKDIAAIRAAVRQYDVLEYNVSQSLSDSEMLTAVGEVLRDLKQSLPQEVPDANLSPAMKAFRDKYGPDVEIGLRPEEVFGVGKNEDGKITSVNPFMDYIRGTAVEIGDVPPPSIMQQWQQKLLGSISGSQVLIEQQRRFAQRMAADTGMTRNQSDAILRLIREKAGQVGASGARGLDRHELYEAARQIKMSKQVRGKMTERQLQLAVFWAYEGSLAKVGVSQKFTGILKSKSLRVPGLSTGGLGILAERLYPNVRFKYNPMFYVQELWESPILLVARGMLSPGQFVDTTELAGKRVKALVRGTDANKAALREAQEGYDELAYQTALMMDVFGTDGRFAADMIEGTDVVRWGSAASQRMASTHEGQMLNKLLTDKGMPYIKARAQTVVFRRSIGDHMARTIGVESPAQWAAIKGHYGTLDDGEAGVRLFNDYLARNSPDSAFSAIAPHSNPGEFIRPAFLGARTRLSPRVISEVLGRSMPGSTSTEPVSFNNLRRAFLDEKQPEVNARWVEETLREAGADEWYIEKAKWHLGAYEGADPEAAFRDSIVKLTGSESEADAILGYHKAIAHDEGVPLLESLADKYMGAPKSLDEAGQFKSNALFQLIADAAEARGLRVPARDAPELAAYWNIGPTKMPDLSLPDGVKTLAWEEHPLARHTELVPLSRLLDIMPGNPAVRMTPKERIAVRNSMKTNGIQEPLQLTYWHQDQGVVVDEGNHRLSILRDTVPEKSRDNYMVPVTVFTHQRSLSPKGATKVAGAVADETGYVSSQLRPSDIGVTTRAEAEFARTKATIGAQSTLTDAQKKGYKAQRIRAARAANPELGLPKPVEGQPKGQLAATNSTGTVTHRIGPGKTHEEWTQEVQSVLTPEEMTEYADWYLDMRRGFMALSDGQQEQAVTLLMAFGVTQLNTSPIAGMRYLRKVMERMNEGATFEELTKLEMQKVGGLNAELLTDFLATGKLRSEGLGFKLIDFIDSLIGNPGRTIPVPGPNGKWGPVAGDIWAKRDMGYVDAKMLKHLKTAYGEKYDITGVKARVKNEEGEWEEVTRSFTLTDKQTGEVIQLPESMVGGNPTDHEYDAIVEFYNDAADYMNEQRFMGRTDWTPPMAQALGWFKAKRVFGDPTGDTRSAFFDNTYTISMEVSPTRNSVASEVYPHLMEETERAIAGRITPKLADEAAHMAGVTVLSQRGSVRAIWDEGATKPRMATVVNIEVMGSPEGAETMAAALGTMGQQGRMRAIKGTVVKPTAKNNVRHAVELRFPADIPREEMYAITKDLAERERFFADAELVPAPDGSYVLRVVAEADETPAQFNARGDDVMLRQFFNETVNEQGYARGRYVNPDEPLQPGKREQEMRQLGEQVQADAIRENAPLVHWQANQTKLSRKLYAETREVHGGFTIDLKNGKVPKAAGAKRGGGPYASAVADTRQVSPTASEEEFTTALDEFVTENRVKLEQGHSLGVFYNEDSGFIEFDVNQIVSSFDEAEALQLVLKRAGGAYDFTTGKGVFKPIFDPKREHGVVRGYAEVIEMRNDWKTQKGGSGYIERLRQPAKEDRHVRERAAGELEREAGDWGRMVYEDAYQSMAAREVADHRAVRADPTDTAPGFDLDDPAGYLQRSPRGSRGTILARGDAQRDATLWQRPSPGAKPRGAITEPGATLSGTGTRSQVYVSPKRRLGDTLAHETAHDWLNRQLQPSGIRRVKAIYAGREGTPPTIGRKSYSQKLTVDEQEWLADQLVEYLRTGDASAMPAPLRPLAAHYASTLNKSRRRPKLNAEAKGLFDSMDKVPPPPKGYNFDVDEEAIIKWLYSAHRRSDRMAADLVHFKTERSWLERSLNHPYFGLYPLSYMWGKILPEMVEFLMFRPFGLKAPLVGANMVNQMYQHVMLQMDSDPELRAFMEENEDAFRAIAMLVPGLPWDLPVNAPLPLRRYIEAAATNVAKDRAGERPEDYGAWETYVSDIDYSRIAGDVIGYTFGPRAGTQSLLEYPGLAADMYNGMKSDPDAAAQDMKFAPPTISDQTAAAPPIPTAPPQQGGGSFAPAPPAAQQPTSRGPIEELEETLSEQYEQVAEGISE